MNKGNCEHREAILDAAVKLLLSKGYKNMTMEEVANNANLGKGTTYLYFESKEDLAICCIQKLVQKLHEKMRLIAKSSLNPAEKLHKMVSARVFFRFEQAKAIHAGSLDDIFESVRKKLFLKREQIHEVERRLLAEVLVEGRTLGYFEFDDAFETALAFVTATNSLLPYNLNSHELGDRTDVEVRFESVFSLLSKGIAAKHDPLQKPVRKN